MNILLAQLLAIRAQVDATIAIIETTEQPVDVILDGPALAAAVVPPVPEGTCPHPASRQRDATTFGSGPQIQCLDCGWKRPGTYAE